MVVRLKLRACCLSRFRNNLTVFDEFSIEDRRTLPEVGTLFEFQLMSEVFFLQFYPKTGP
jgi:hypothetical protein